MRAHNLADTSVPNSTAQPSGPDILTHKTHRQSHWPMKQSRQRVLVLYLADSALDSKVVAWSRYDGTGEDDAMAGDQDEPPYATGLAALKDGWRLFQASTLEQHVSGNELRTGYLKYEFWFEQWPAE